MTKAQIVVIAVVVLVVDILGVNAFDRRPTPPDSLEFAAIQTDIKATAKLYDVRTSQEFNAGHFESAENWPLKDMQSGKLPDVNKNTKIYLYCQSGNRSSQAAALLSDAGFTDVIDLGGLQDVQQIGGAL